MTQKKSKKELRILRKLTKQKKQKNKNARLSSSVVIENKIIRSHHKPDIIKHPRSADPENYKKYYFSWCLNQADIIGRWTWGEPRQWSDNEYSDAIRPHMNSHNNDSWNNVESKTYNGKGGYRKSLNKYQPLCSLVKEAQRRWWGIDLISQFEELFRLRLGSSKRIWGVRIQHHFYMIWYERHHRIYPIK
ncbi:hypothetical protein QUF90_13080 [Desulfococcaceae bacterium HSG9]|nr:hypothetical protein [Desulfococcaceae bacterium HSG9]